MKGVNMKTILYNVHLKDDYGCNEDLSRDFIISDEFAELKDQRPEFMDQLISTENKGKIQY